MTIDILFFEDGKPILRVNIGCSNLYCHIISELNHEEIEKWIPNFNASEDMAFTDPEFIKRVWNLCVQHNYIANDYDILGNFVDKMSFVF